LITRQLPRLSLLTLFSFLCITGFCLSKKALKFYQKGKKAFENHLLVEATAQFTQAINQIEKYAAAYVDRGRSYLGMNKVDRAVKDFEKCLKIDPALMVPKYQLSSDLQKKEQLQKENRNYIPFH
jgi:tetratricopeptide (TPR) repeat protein